MSPHFLAYHLTPTPPLIGYPSEPTLWPWPAFDLCADPSQKNRNNCQAPLSREGGSLNSTGSVSLSQPPPSRLTPWPWAGILLPAVFNTFSANWYGLPTRPSQPITVHFALPYPKSGHWIIVDTESSSEFVCLPACQNSIINFFSSENVSLAMF